MGAPMHTRWPPPQCSRHPLHCLPFVPSARSTCRDCVQPGPGGEQENRAIEVTLESLQRACKPPDTSQSALAVQQFEPIAPAWPRPSPWPRPVYWSSSRHSKGHPLSWQQRRCTPDTCFVPYGGFNWYELTVRSRPFRLLRGYWSREKAAAAKQQVLDLMATCEGPGEGGDMRTMQADGIADREPTRYPLLLEFTRDKTLQAMAEHHLRRKDLPPTSLLAGHTLPGQASGGGWHKDAKFRGFKAMIYLDDVDASNGPFAMLLGYNDTSLKANADKRKTRYDDEAIHDQVARGARVKELHAPAGSVIVFETSNVHRGMPCRERSRVSLTNYYGNRLPGCRHGK